MATTTAPGESTQDDLATTTVPVEYTPDDLLRLESEGRFELLDGRLVEKPRMGAQANRIASLLHYQVEGHALAQKLGVCFTQKCGYQIFGHDSRRVRYPD